MGAFQAVALGIVQGLTEFLPVSSTGHIRIVSGLFGWDDPGAAFSAVIQLGTMAAVLVYFRADLWRMTRAFASSLPSDSGQLHRQAGTLDGHDHGGGVRRNPGGEVASRLRRRLLGLLEPAELIRQQRSKALRGRGLPAIDRRHGPFGTTDGEDGIDRHNRVIGRPRSLLKQTVRRR